ncbi:DUF2125 domain-containing protein [Methylopila sp. M107]|uniref:DUF2125 domain-containing protein n=1 Tax=Methylopila sp. M107 TaxID=1101190 RepID=UPI000371F2A4|nr:DUF2125 domain-containing protein [Methylopila sp. M107]
MTSAADSVPAPQPRRRRLVVAVALVALLVAAWSGAWMWAAGKAGDTIDVVLKREADRGRVYACAERRIGGFPFRIEVDCANPTARIAAKGGETSASAPRLVAVAQVWDPKRVTGELTGPIEFRAPDGQRGNLSFNAAKASFRADGRRFEQGAVSLKTPRLVLGDDEIGAAASAEGDLRKAPDGPAGAYDVSASLEGVVSPFLALLPVGEGPVAVALQAQATGLDSVGPGSLPERLKDFAEGGGRVAVALARIERGDVAAQAKGDLALDPEGRLNGALDVTARGVDGAINDAIGADGGDTVSALLGMGAKMLGKKTDLDGKPATRYRLKFDKGRVALGPIRLTRVPPAF